jgi:cell division septation protein DedD
VDALPDPEPADGQPPDVSADLYRAIIGPRNQAGYLRRFAVFEAHGKTRLVWHWPAFFSALNWLVFRGMWGAALGYAAGMLTLTLVLFGIGRLTFDFSGTTARICFVLFLLGTSAAAGLWAHALYYGFCKRQVIRAVAASASMQDARHRLAAQAPSHKRLWLLVAANTGVLALLVGGAMLVRQSGFSRMDASRAREAVPTGSSQGAVSLPAVSVPTVAASVPAVPTIPAVPAVRAPVVAAAEPRFFVQAGVFAVENNALTLQEKLEAAGFRVHTLGVKTPTGVRIQVRVGPFDSKAQASDAVGQLKSMDLPGVILKL